MVSILGQAPGLRRYILGPACILTVLAYFPATLSYARKLYNIGSTAGSSHKEVYQYTEMCGFYGRKNCIYGREFTA
jgi:hypothetical protein